MNFKDIVFKQTGYELSAYQLEQFEKYFAFLIEYNKNVNLTRITEKDDVYIKHFLDSIIVINLIDFTKINTLLDMGSGAGFPGIPLKILYPHLEVLLVDARKKKLVFLEKLFEVLNLSNITTTHSRLEDLDYKNYFDLATARALSDLNTISKYAYPLIKTGGHIISYKSQSYETELREFSDAWKGKLKIERVDYQELPNESGARYNVLIRKQ